MSCIPHKGFSYLYYDKKNFKSSTYPIIASYIHAIILLKG
jgi:hypothetical protein